jgi:hypothetical protein
VERWGIQVANERGDLRHNPFSDSIEELEQQKGDSKGAATMQHLFKSVDVKALIRNNDKRLIPKKVCIVGGGISGLIAAYELSEVYREFRIKGEITVLEKSNNFGGRIHTHYFDKNNFVEMGPMRIPSDHLMTLDYLTKFDIPTKIFHHDQKFFLSNAFKNTFGFPPGLKSRLFSPETMGDVLRFCVQNDLKNSNTNQPERYLNIDWLKSINPISMEDQFMTTCFPCETQAVPFCQTSLLLKQQPTAQRAERRV